MVRNLKICNSLSHYNLHYFYMRKKINLNSIFRDSALLKFTLQVQD